MKNGEDEIGIVKDEKVYWIFKCSKCEQYMYVRPTQKRKKCLRCGKTHTVDKLDLVDDVKGMTAAVKRVKELQNKLVKDPTLSGTNEFSFASAHKKSKKPILQMNESEQETQFYGLLQNLAEKYTKFPYYLIELIAQEYKIDSTEMRLFIRKFVKIGILRKLDRNYYSLS